MYLYFGGGIFAEFLGIFLQFFWIFFSWTLLKIFLAQDNSGFNGQMMEFLVQLSHDGGSQSHDLHHMFLHSFYCAFGTGFQSVWLTQGKGHVD